MTKSTKQMKAVVVRVEDGDVEDQECPECEEEMEYWNAEKTKTADLEESLDSEAQVFVMWQEKDCEQAGFFWCQDCEILEVSHKQCNTLMHCMGHQGFSRSGSENMRDSKTGMKANLSNPKPIDPNKPRYELHDIASTKIRVNEWYPAGPDGRTTTAQTDRLRSIPFDPQPNHFLAEPSLNNPITCPLNVDRLVD